VIEFVKRYLTWWNGATVGTRLFTRRNGIEVGRDDGGNIYYRNADSSRRWVMFAGEVEATKISAEWHGWMHFTWDEPPTEKPMARKAWEKPHQANLTGTDAAYHPPGSITTAATRPRVTGDYTAWQPE
jgi:NADH:ubiquinone oxidoreductase subunit